MNDYVHTAKTEDAKIGWNWGAFMLSPIFGIGNKAYLCLLTLIPVFNFIWYFVSGAMGAKWAYESGDFQSVSEFNASMRTWNRAGFVLFIISAISLTIYLALWAFIFKTLFVSNALI